EGRRLVRNEDRVGREQRRAQQGGDARRTAGDDMIGMTSKLRRFAVERVARQADDAEQTRVAASGALFGPIERRSLRVRVDEGHALSLTGPMPVEVQGERRLADAALLVEQRDDHRSPSSVFHRSSARPTTEELDSSVLESKLGAS